MIPQIEYQHMQDILRGELGHVFKKDPNHYGVGVLSGADTDGPYIKLQNDRGYHVKFIGDLTPKALKILADLIKRPPSLHRLTRSSFWYMGKSLIVRVVGAQTPCQSYLPCVEAYVSMVQRLGEVYGEPILLDTELTAPAHVICGAVFTTDPYCAPSDAHQIMVTCGAPIEVSIAFKSAPDIYLNVFEDRSREILDIIETRIKLDKQLRGVSQ